MEQKVYKAPMMFDANGEAGQVKAAFATLNVIDMDGDVTLPGAFANGEPVRIAAWQHNWGVLPVGKGTIGEENNQAVLNGQFFLDTNAGKEHYLTIKALGDLQEWSYGFDVVDYELGKFNGQDVRFLKKLKVHEVSPVMLGAGIDTQTLYIKGQKTACPTHTTAMSDAAWDGPANEARVRSGESVAYYRRIYAWQDVEGDPTVKSSWRFIHHEVAGDGTPGAANIRACQTGIGVLNGARGGTVIPDSDKQGVWNHLAKHLRDADLEPAPLKAIKEGRRNSSADLDAIQRIHDLTCDLGAKCAASEAETPQDETSGGKSASKASVLRVRAVADLIDQC